MEFAPSIYEHAARIAGRSPWEVSRDGALLASAHAEAFRLYGHRPVVVGIDIYNLEAEAYGAVVERPSGNGIPAISRHPYSRSEQLKALRPFDPAKDGRIPMVIEAALRVQRACPEADVRIPVSGPFSVATNLMGFEELLCEIQTRPEAVSEALHHLAAGQVEFCREVRARGLDIAFFESAAVPPLLSPEQFRAVEFGPLKATMEGAAAVVGHGVPCVMGGDTAPILGALLETGTGYVCCPVGTDQRLFMEKMKSRPEVMVRINMDPRPIVSQNTAAVEKEVDRVTGLAENRRLVCIGTGCLPFEADPWMVLKTRDYVLSKNT